MSIAWGISFIIKWQWTRETKISKLAEPNFHYLYSWWSYFVNWVDYDLFFHLTRFRRWFTVKWTYAFQYNKANLSTEQHQAQKNTWILCSVFTQSLSLQVLTHMHVRTLIVNQFLVYFMSDLLIICRYACMFKLVFVLSLVVLMLKGGLINVSVLAD